ncbi:hypothetical protein [Actinoplanes palleronii]|nr:hypothetical protein [Actinoplanes palleronii]
MPIIPFPTQRGPSRPEPASPGHRAPAIHASLSSVLSRVGAFTLDLRNTTAPAHVPDAAMLQPADLRGATGAAVTGDRWAGLCPPRPDLSSASPLAGTVVAERAMSAVVTVDDRPTLVLEYLSVHGPDDPARYLRDLRASLEQHLVVDGGGHLWSITGRDVAGPDSLLLRLRRRFRHDGDVVTTDVHVAVAAAGRVLVMVADTGWETTDGRPALVQELIAPAVQRARRLR